MPKRKIDWSGLEEFRKSLPEYRRQEYYRFLAVAWDIAKVLYLLEKVPRETVKLQLNNAPRVYGVDHPESSIFGFDPKADEYERVDISRPVIMALIDVGNGSDPEQLLIDGYNRMYKAWKLGEKEIPCYILRPEEERMCRA